MAIDAPDPLFPTSGGLSSELLLERDRVLYVAHDCVIGDFVTFAPGVKCNGNIIVEDHAYVGTGAVIKQGRPDRPLVIGRGAVVGMGSVVTKDVPPGETVVGNPARPLSRS